MSKVLQRYGQQVFMEIIAYLAKTHFPVTENQVPATILVTIPLSGSEQNDSEMIRKPCAFLVTKHLLVTKMDLVTKMVTKSFW